MSGRCLIGGGRPLSEKPSHEDRADRQYIPTQAMHGINPGINAGVCSKRNMEPTIGHRRGQLQRAGNRTKAV
jgi:hypothetical protein